MYENFKGKFKTLNFLNCNFIHTQFYVQAEPEIACGTATGFSFLLALFDFSSVLTYVSNVTETLSTSNILILNAKYI